MDFGKFREQMHASLVPKRSAPAPQMRRAVLLARLLGACTRRAGYSHPTHQRTNHPAGPRQVSDQWLDQAVPNADRSAFSRSANTG